jgi:hypothetical protein
MNLNPLLKHNLPSRSQNRTNKRGGGGSPLSQVDRRWSKGFLVSTFSYIPHANSMNCYMHLSLGCFKCALRWHSTWKTLTFQISHILTLSVSSFCNNASSHCSGNKLQGTVARFTTGDQIQFHSRITVLSGECWAIHINLQAINHSHFQTGHMVTLCSVTHVWNYCTVREKQTTLATGSFNENYTSVT